MKKPTTIIGVLGGIGPEATGYFYNNVIQRLQNKMLFASNVEFPQIIINSIPAPELVNTTAPPERIEPYIKGVKQLTLFKPNFIVMICNTIHIYREEIVRKSGYVNILSLQEMVRASLKDVKKPMCVLGTHLTVKSGLYTFNEYEYINPTDAELKIIGEVVKNFTTTGEKEKNTDRLMKIVENKQKAGVKTFVLACTEISKLLGDKNIPTKNTLEILIDNVVALT